MKDITENLIVLLEKLYAKEKQVREIVDIMQGEPLAGPGFLNKYIGELELVIIQYLGGQKKHLSYMREIDKELDPFYNFEHGRITKSEFLKQVKRVIDLDLEPEFY